MEPRPRPAATTLMRTLPLVNLPIRAATLAAACLLPVPAALAAQAADSLDVHKLQAEFERFRESHTPVERGRLPSGICDQFIGRICIRYGGEEEESFPAELSEVHDARIQLIDVLSRAFERAPDRWVLGQLVRYLLENRELDRAQRVAEACGIPETWWCTANQGFVLHMQRKYVDAEAVFREALAAMPDTTRDEWMTRYVLTGDALDEVESAPPEERERMLGLFWALSDPLFLFEGNDRFTDHLSRWVLATDEKEAANPLGMEWDEDLEETLIRYGRNIGYSRTFEPERMMGGLQDTRRMVGHHNPKSRGYLFPEEFLVSPSDIPPESWITAPRKARAWYAPTYTPEIRGLETQVGRFRRDDGMLVVGAYRPTLPDSTDPEVMIPVWGDAEGPAEPPYATLFLIPENGSLPFNVRSRDAEGVLTIQARPGRYVSSLEVVDLPGRRAWRARQGVVQQPLTPGLVSVSDLMILKEGAPLPESLDDALPWLRPGVRLRSGERFPVLWEVYGLRVQEPVRVTIGFSKGRPGFLARVADFLGIIQTDESIEITFEELGPDQVQTAFRSMVLTLPDLEPGDYTLHLRLDLPGREPVVTSRPIVVED